MDVFRSALSLVIHKNGNVEERDVTDLLGFYAESKGITICKEAYQRALNEALRQYHDAERKLYVCTDKPCIRSSYLNPAGASLQELSERLGCAVESTGCHWQCENAPVVTLKHQQNKTTYLHCVSERWAEVLRDIANKRTCAAAERGFAIADH
ncbi:MAG: hypothetical protein K2W95_15090 [Candidatus Obscuribacterales bacterium]|nr:hypothetical protein [Candidatus Obscuribacterales bacterium]